MNYPFHAEFDHNCSNHVNLIFLIEYLNLENSMHSNGKTRMCYYEASEFLRVLVKGSIPIDQVIFSFVITVTSGLPL